MNEATHHLIPLISDADICNALDYLYTAKEFEDWVFDRINEEALRICSERVRKENEACN